MPTVFIGVGSNLGDRKSHFDLAQKELSKVRGIRGLKCSSVYETDPQEVGGGKFLNAVWSFGTTLKPRQLLEALQGIEKKAGRVRKGAKEARELDLDILFYGDQVIDEPGLQVPHPRLEERAFVLMPFCDLAPEWEHPVLRRMIGELFTELSAKGKAQSAKSAI